MKDISDIPAPSVKKNNLNHVGKRLTGQLAKIENKSFWSRQGMSTWEPVLAVAERMSHRNIGCVCMSGCGREHLSEV